MKWPLVTRRRLDRELADVRADSDRLRRERDQFREDRDTQLAVARKATAQYADLYDRFTDTAIVNECLTEKLAAACEKTNVTDNDWRARYEGERKRADLLQARIDDAVGLSDPRVEDGRYWQRTREDKRGVAS